MLRAVLVKYINFRMFKKYQFGRYNVCTFMYITSLTICSPHQVPIT